VNGSRDETACGVRTGHPAAALPFSS
jgi:hypothetical protein